MIGPWIELHYMKRKLRRDKVSIRSLYLQAENLVHFRRGRIVLRQHVITPKRLQVTASHHSRMYCLFTDQIVVRDAKEPLSELGVKLYRLTYLSKRIHTPLGLALNTVTCFCFLFFFLHGARAPSGPDLPQIRGFTITLRHAIVGGNPSDEGSARRTDLYLTAYNTRERQTLIPPGGIRNHNPRKRETAEPRLRQRGHCYRQ